MYKAVVVGTLALTLSYIPVFAHPKTLVDCEEHLGSRISRDILTTLISSNWGKV